MFIVTRSYDRFFLIIVIGYYATFIAESGYFTSHLSLSVHTWHDSRRLCLCQSMNMPNPVYLQHKEIYKCLFLRFIVEINNIYDICGFVDLLLFCKRIC